MLSIKQRLHFVAVAVGLFGCYSIFGILQEKIFRGGYGNVQFTFSVTFVCLQCVFYCLLAKSILMTHNHSQNETPQKFFGFTAVFYLVGLVTSNSALQYISYPSQVVGKALKPIPTMIFGFWVGGKSYAIHKYIFVVLIVSGAILFLYKPDAKSNESNLGYILVGISLLCNGGTAGVQEKMRAVARPSSLNLMLYLNFWSSIFLTIGVVLSSELEGFIAFCRHHPEILIQIALLLVVGGCGQFFTACMITNYGVVPCCLVLTVRKFFNVLFSVVYSGNVLTARQWLAIALIFTSLLTDAALSAKYREQNKDESKASIKIVKTEKNSLVQVKV